MNYSKYKWEPAISYGYAGQETTHDAITADVKEGLIYFTDKNAIGVLTTVAGIIPEIAAALVFQQAKEANKRLDDFYNKLIELEEFNKAFEITQTTSEENQDHYKGLIISRLLGLHVKEDEIGNRNSNSRTSSAYSEGEHK